jgi:lysozyme family protein
MTDFAAISVSDDLIFDKAFELILSFEGKETKDPDDPGGRTKFGITERSYAGMDFDLLTKEQAKSIYFSDYWLRCGCPQYHPAIAIVLFDIAVNQGPNFAIRTIQRLALVKTDGIVGPVTISAVKGLDPKEAVISLTFERIMRYFKTTGFLRFGRGWVKRACTTAVFATQFITD